MTDNIDKQTASHLGGHSQGGGCSGGWRDVPSDSQTTLQKLRVGISGRSGRDLENHGSENPESVSSRTRSRHKEAADEEEGEFEMKNKDGRAAGAGEEEEFEESWSGDGDDSAATGQGEPDSTTDLLQLFGGRIKRIRIVS